MHVSGPLSLRVYASVCLVVCRYMSSDSLCDFICLGVCVYVLKIWNDCILFGA